MFDDLGCLALQPHISWPCDRLGQAVPLGVVLVRLHFFRCVRMCHILAALVWQVVWRWEVLPLVLHCGLDVALLMLCACFGMAGCMGWV